MPRVLFRLTAGVVLTIGLVALAPADDKDKKDDKKPAPSGKPPTWAGYVAFSTVELPVKSATDESILVTVSGPAVLSRTGYSRYSRPTLKEGKKETIDLSFHEDAVVRWAKLPPKVDANGKKLIYTNKEMEAIKQPKWATGYAADKSDLAADQIVELVLLRPKSIPAEKVTPADLRIKQATILTDPPWPTADGKKKDAKKGDKKDKK